MSDSISLDHVTALVREQDQYIDLAHRLNHCYDVLAIVIQNIDFIDKVPGLANERVLLIMIAASLLHEIYDRKRIQPCDKASVNEALEKDGFLPEEIKIINWLISYCSFSKQNHEGRRNPEMREYEKMMQLLSSADLAEAVNESALRRSYEYQRAEMVKGGHENPSEEECWRDVLSFYANENNGFFPRLRAITVKGIRDSLEPTLQITAKNIEELKKKYNVCL